MGQLSRRPDWPQRLHVWLAAARARPFAWGDWDCCVFADGAIAAVTGARPFADLWGAYDDALGARRVMRAAGAGSLDDLLDLRLPRRTAALARRGDLAGVPSHDPAWPAIGVVTGRQVHALGLAGLAAVPLARMRAVWGVG